jgi:nicotinate-nucleotide adenylyltransferase
MVADDRELRRPPPSYAVDTVRELRAAHPGARIFLLIGQDNLAGLPGWREFEALRELAEFVVFLREGAGAPESCPYARLERRVEISSTEIRNRVASGRSLRYLVPGTVESHIRRNQLYLHPFPAEGNIPTSPPA